MSSNLSRCVIVTTIECNVEERERGEREIEKERGERERRESIYYNYTSSA